VLLVSLLLCCCCVFPTFAGIPALAGVHPFAGISAAAGSIFCVAPLLVFMLLMITCCCWHGIPALLLTSLMLLTVLDVPVTSAVVDPAVVNVLAVLMTLCMEFLFCLFPGCCLCP
jgi:hypothetical protein